MRGGQHQVLLLLNGLRGAGHESIVMAREKAPLGHAATTAGFAVYPAETKQLWQLSKRVDIVHAHDARAHTIAAIGARRRFVVSRRVAFPVQRSVASVWKYHRATRFLAVSQFVAQQLLAAGVRRDKIDVVYDGVGTGPSERAWNDAGPVVSLETDDAQKGRDLVERSATLAGMRVVFSKDLPEDLRTASLFVYITQSEGLGSAALLAMSMGVPVIASCIGGLTEVFEDGISGIFVRNEAQEIAAAMRRVMADRELRRNLAENGRARVAECFTKEHLVRRTVSSYERALAG